MNRTKNRRQTDRKCGIPKITYLHSVGIPEHRERIHNHTNDHHNRNNKNTFHIVRNTIFKEKKVQVQRFLLHGEKTATATWSWQLMAAANAKWARICSNIGNNKDNTYTTLIVSYPLDRLNDVETCTSYISWERESAAGSETFKI